MGGCTLFIEVAKANQQREDGKPRVGTLLITGNLQDVMK